MSGKIWYALLILGSTGVAAASDLPNPFRRFDSNGDGFLDLAELRKATQNTSKKRATSDGVTPSKKPAVVETHGLVETMLDLADNGAPSRPLHP